ncbi:MAG: DNA recombination protein RmuC [Bacteroidia bacterium]|nr:DNA recombination protein RmuC [Bacteroidia bacterium]
MAWLYFKNQVASGINESEKNELDRTINELQNLLTTAERDKAVLQEKISNSVQEVGKLSQQYETERKELTVANSRLAKAEEAFKNMNDKLAAQKAEFEEMQKRFTTEFENIANKILDEKSKKFTEQNKTNIDGILSPLKEKIEKFEKTVGENYDKELRDRISLKEEVKKLFELNNRISEEANNLTKALKGDNKKQGNWGEVILEKILERSGLVKDREYKTQITTMNVEGETIKPDVVIYLPDEKHIVVDSKVSLLAYDAYVNADEDEGRERYIKEHLSSVKSHIKLLSEKNYQTSSEFNSPDFVLLFIPIESSFSVAIQADQDLFNYAWDRKIVVVSPSTLLATLRTIASIWKQERQNRNALEIARIGGSLYDELYRFIDDMKDIEKHLHLSHEAYDSAFKRLSQGKGNLITTAEKIKTLGAKATKSINRDLIDDAGNAANTLEENKP